MSNIATLAETDQAYFNISLPTDDVATNQSVLTGLAALHSLAHDEQHSLYLVAGAKPTFLELKDAQQELELSMANLATANDEVDALKREIIEAHERRTQMEAQLEDARRHAEAHLVKVRADLRAQHEEAAASLRVQLASSQAALAQSQHQNTELRATLVQMQGKLDKLVGAHTAIRTIFDATDTPMRHSSTVAPGSPTHALSPTPPAAAPAAAQAPVPAALAPAPAAPAPAPAPAAPAPAPAPEATSPARLLPSSPSARSTDPRVPPGSVASQLSNLSSRLPDPEELAGYFGGEDDENTTCDDCGRVCNSASGLRNHVRSCPISREKRQKTTHPVFVVIERGTMHRQTGATILWTVDDTSRVREGYTVDQEHVRSEPRRLPIGKKTHVHVVLSRAVDDGQAHLRRRVGLLRSPPRQRRMGHSEARVDASGRRMYRVARQDAACRR
jgi:hypothetical protein